jgi:hypothetical protein
MATWLLCVLIIESIVNLKKKALNTVNMRMRPTKQTAMALGLRVHFTPNKNCTSPTEVMHV